MNTTGAFRSENRLELGMVAAEEEAAAVAELLRAHGAGLHRWRFEADGG